MKAAELDEYALAGLVRCQKRTVDTWITGERMPEKEREIALADALNVSLDWLAGRTESPN